MASPPFLGAKMGRVLLRNLCDVGGSQKRGQQQNRRNYWCLLLAPGGGRYFWVTNASLMVPRKWQIITSGCMTATCSGTQKWAVLLCNYCVHNDPPK